MLRLDARMLQNAEMYARLGPQKAQLDAWVLQKAGLTSGL